MRHLNLGSRVNTLQLHVYGAYADEPSKALEKPALGLYIKGALVVSRPPCCSDGTGFTSDAIKTMRKYRINFAPLRAGAGIKVRATLAYCNACLLATLTPATG